MPNSLKNFDDSSKYMPLKIGYQPGHPDLFRLLSTIMSSPSIA